MGTSTLGISRALSTCNQIHYPQNLGSFHGNLQPDVAAEPTQGLSTAQNPAMSSEEELPEAGKAHRSSASSASLRMLCS